MGGMRAPGSDAGPQSRVRRRQGPNTGGMGAYCDSRILTEAQTREVLERVIHPTVERTRFTGFLYAGLMMTADGPKVLEFNVRLGDPETQPLMHRMESDFVPALMAAAEGRLAGARLEWKSGPSVCVVLASGGYPGDVRDRRSAIQRNRRSGGHRGDRVSGGHAGSAAGTGNRRRAGAGRDGSGARPGGSDRRGLCGVRTDSF